ncbi:hypothetical protein [Halobacterium bonnevillei]|uniref:Uncharacterized protein n=1 Tax=Halobacterium bonnevillei TaxID=2692200 RepID=A0A6B0SCW7_9EURY|nr:hypothetical protein [Halobacterium bonnevillei]MXR19228.1 hypothetical protein [Halobacterium bonnevillei]
MEYSRKFSTDELGLSGMFFVEYYIGESDAGRYLDATLELTDLPSKLRGEKLHIEGGDGIRVSRSIIETSADRFEFELYLPPDCSSISIRLDSGEEAYCVDIADTRLLSLGNEILQDDVFNPTEFKTGVQAYRRENTDIWPLVDFACSLGELVPFDTYLSSLEKIITSYPRVRNEMNNILETLLKRLILGECCDGRHEISELSTLETTVEAFSSIDDRAQIDASLSIKYAVDALHKRQEPDQIIDLVFEFNIVESHHDVMTDKLFHLVLAEEVLRQSESGVQNLLDRYFKNEIDSEFDQDEFQNAVKDAKAVDEPNPADWFEIVKSAGSNPGTGSLKFTVANLLFNTAEAYNDVDGYYHITPQLYAAAGAWYDELDIAISQRALFDHHTRKGLLHYHETELNDASGEMERAIETATNVSGEYENAYPEWLTTPVIYKALADARTLTAEGRREDAAELLKQRGQVFEDFGSLSEDSIQRITSAIGGERFRILSDKFLNNGEYERAEEVLGKAIGLFKEGGLERAGDNTLNKKKEVSVVIEEVNGNFTEAAASHDQISENDHYNKSKRNVHEIRAQICRAKAQTIDGNYEIALERIREINRQSDELQQDALDLGILNQLLLSYENGEVTNAKRALEKFTTSNQNKTPSHPLGVDYDYTELFVVVLALQRLNQTDLPEDLLRSLIQLSINRSFTPRQNQQFVQETYLEDISIDRLWRERLPSPVLSRVEEIQLEQASTAGNYKSVTLLLAELLEFYLALLVEFHGKHYWGDTWRSELVTEDEDEENLSIGVLSRIFTSDAATEIQNTDELDSILTADIAEFANLIDMRNKLDHAYTGHIDQDTFESIRERVFELLRSSVGDAPLAVSIQDKNLAGVYTARIHWWRGLRHILINTEAELNVGSYYYMPLEIIQESDDQVLYSIGEEDLVLVEDSRITDQMPELD